MTTDPKRPTDPSPELLADLRARVIGRELGASPETCLDVGRAYIASAEKQDMAASPPPSPPETPAPHEKWCKAIDFTSEAKCDCGLPSRVAYVPRPAPETPATEGGALRWAAKMLNENNGTVRDDGLFVEVRVLKAHWESLRVEAQSAPASPASAPRETTEEPKTCNFLQRIDALRAIEADSGERVRALERGALTRIASLARDRRRPEAQLDRIADVARRALSPQGDGGTP